MITDIKFAYDFKKSQLAGIAFKDIKNKNLSFILSESILKVVEVLSTILK